ncbi:MAG: hypothetical protein P9L97_05865 [Candidatus Tenebribacter davisii]|nr:hypothetical protein [Candidatus Tenebribacter davisii]
MAKVIKKTNARAKVSIQAEIDGKLVTATTVKKCVGSHVAEAEKCVACKKSQPNVGAICMVKTAPVPKAKTKKASGTKIERPFSLVIAQITAGTDRKEIVDELLQNGFKGSAKSFVSSIGCVINALDGNSRKKEGTIARYCDWLNSGSKGDIPSGDAGSIWYCKKVWAILNEAE